MDYSGYYKGKSILVTGGTGSIGKELVKKLVKLDINTIRVLDNNETALFELGEELGLEKLRLFIGDIRDEERLDRAVEGIDIVFHAAALKHVPLCEYNPFDAVKTNIIGTQNVLNSALNQNVEKVVLISTDKAANPVNVMGATKLLAERLTLAANSYKGNRRTTFSCVRFGNVLGSRGSVIPTFMQQIKSGGPVTITDPEMTRFIMSIPKSVELILKAGQLSRYGEIFIFKMPALNIKHLAESMIRHFSGIYSIDDKTPVKIIGKRPGEKLYEELMTETESENAYENDEMFIIHSYNPYSDDIIEMPGGFVKAVNKNYLSSDVKLLSQEEIIEIFRNNSL